MNLRRFCGLLNLSARRLIAAICDVVIDGIVKQDRVLRNNTNGLVKAALSNIPDILPVDQNRAKAGVIKAE